MSSSSRSSSKSTSLSQGPVSPGGDAEAGLFDRMIHAWIAHYQRLVDAGSHPV